MAMTVWASTDDLTNWGLTPLPDNATALLRSATLLIARAINENPYSPGIVIDDPRKDATTAQAVTWARAGIDPTAGPSAVAKVVKSKAIASGSITYDTPTAADREAAISNLAPDAHNILYAAGLLSTEFPVPQWSDLPDPGVYVGEIGQVHGYPIIGPYYGPTGVAGAWGGFDGYPAV